MSGEQMASCVAGGVRLLPGTTTTISFQLTWPADRKWPLRCAELCVLTSQPKVAKSFLSGTTHEVNTAGSAELLKPPVREP